MSVVNTVEWASFAGESFRELLENVSFMEKMFVDLQFATPTNALHWNVTGLTCRECEKMSEIQSYAVESIANSTAVTPRSASRFAICAFCLGVNTSPACVEFVPPAVLDRSVVPVSPLFDSRDC